MANLRKWAVVFSCTALTLGSLNLPVQAQLTCPNTNPTPVSTTVRTAHLPSLGIQVTIPSDHRAMLFNDGSVQIVDPWTFNNLLCLAKGLPAARTEYNTQEFRLIDNPERLTAAELAEIPIASEITNSSHHKIQDLDVFIQVPNSPAAYHYVYAWLQLPESDQILRVSLEGSPADLLELLQHCIFL